MLNRRHLLGALALSAAIPLGSIASAADKRAFDQKAFEEAQAAGKPILVEVHASWCPVCKAQAPILSRLRNEAKYKELVSFEIDFDSQKDLLKKFKVQRQSTLIVYKGKQEAGRLDGWTGRTVKAVQDLQGFGPGIARFVPAGVNRARCFGTPRPSVHACSFLPSPANTFYTVPQAALQEALSPDERREPTRHHERCGQRRRDHADPARARSIL